MKRKLLVILMTLVMVVTIIPLNTQYADAYAYRRTFKGSECTTNSVAAATIDYITARYKLWGTWKGSGQCYGYAEKINSLLGASTYTVSCKKKWNKTNIKNLLLNTKAGAHVRFENKVIGMYHSIVILKCTEKEVIWTDGNYDYNNGIRYTVESFDDFVAFRNDGNTYITSVKKVKTYKYHSTPLLASKRSGTKVALYWTKVKNATSYKVYRASSEHGTYKKIGTTTKRNFVDENGPIGRKRYYKIVAVKKSGSVKSNVTSGTRIIANPTGIKVGNNLNTGKIKITWKAVKGADNYKIFRYDSSKGKYIIVRTTTNLSYTDTKSSKVGSYQYYKIKAYKKSTNTYSTGVELYGMVGVARPTNVTVAAASTTNPNPKIKWTKVPGATGYIIYRCDTKTGTYQWLDEIYSGSTCSYVDEEFAYIYDGEIYDIYNNGDAYYKVAACFSDGWDYYVSNKSLSAHYHYDLPPAPEPDPEPDYPEDWR